MSEVFPKAPTGITGFDQITGGGLPAGRTSLVCGGPGCGKTLFALEFIIRGAIEHNEPGVIITFEETEKELTKNVASLGFNLQDLVERKLVYIDYIHIERSEIEETGDYDLEALFLRLSYAVELIGARRVAMDTIEALFAGLPNEMILRAELRRLFRWLKDRGLSSIVTAERGDGSLTRHGLEEYVSDCVILLDHRVNNQISTRRLRVVKYRGSSHGTNEFPFLIGDEGISVLPITSFGLGHGTSQERVSTGVLDLDAMLEGKGFYKGSSVLVTGTAGTGKTSLAAHFAKATCQRGEKTLYFSFEESPPQLARNMASIGVDFSHFIQKGLLHIHSARPTLQGLEMHLVEVHKLLERHSPDAVIVDPISNLLSIGDDLEVQGALMRLIDSLKDRQITTMFTSLTTPGNSIERTEVGVSSLMDTWILLKAIESDGERNRGLYVLKSRGMAHSNQIREMVLTSNGIKLLEVYLGTEGVLTGAARVSRESRDRTEALLRRQQTERRRRETERKEAALEAKIAALRAEFEAERDQIADLIEQDQERESILKETHELMAEIRQDRGATHHATSSSNGS